MKRWQLACVFAALALSLTLASCDAMFESNIFAKIVEREISTETVGDMSTAEVAELTESETAMATLTEDPAAKDVVLVRLESVFLDDETGDPLPVTPDNAAEIQTASLAAGTVIIETVPVAADFSGGLVTTMLDMMTDESSTTGDFDIGATLEALVPADVVAAIDLGAAEPPASFTTIVSTFFEASSAYSALNASLLGETLDTIALNSEEVVGAAINAILCYAITGVELGVDVGPHAPYDLSTATGIANLFWDQLTAAPTGVDPMTLENIYPEILSFDNFDPSLELGNILGLLGLDAIFSSSGV